MNLPIAFEQKMKNILGSEYDAFIKEFEMPRTKAFHLNPLRTPSGYIPSISGDPVPGSKDCYYYEYDRISTLPEYQAGMIYSQDPAATRPISALLPMLKGNELVLDLCAAPGGKTSQLAAHLPEGLLVSNEINPQRNKILISNIERMGYDNVYVTKLLPAELAAFYPLTFDICVCDAPCSGEGMFRKYPESVNEWSPENVILCQNRQKEILQSAFEMIKPGGYLVYSTCTYSPEEDEMISDYITQNHFNSVLDTPEGVKLYPHRFKGEGQYYNIFRKEGTSTVSNVRPAAVKPVSGGTLKLIKEALKDNFDYSKVTFIDYKSRIIILPVSAIALPSYGLTMAGITAGEIDKNRFIVHHQLFHSLGKYFNNRVELSDINELNAYLQGQEIIHSDVHNGYGVVTYMGQPVGGFKASNNRLKNHYPKGLRLI